MELLKYVFLVDNAKDNRLFFNLKRLDSDFSCKKKFTIKFLDGVGVQCDILIICVEFVDGKVQLKIQVYELEEKKINEKKSKGKYIDVSEDYIINEIKIKLIDKLSKPSLDDRSQLLIDRLVGLWECNKILEIIPCPRNPIIEDDKNTQINIESKSENALILNYNSTCSLRNHIVILTQYLNGKSGAIHQENLQGWIKKQSLISQAVRNNKDIIELKNLFNSSKNLKQSSFSHDFMLYTNEIIKLLKLDIVMFDKILNVISKYADYTKKIKKIAKVKSESSKEYLNKYFILLDTDFL